MNRPKLLKGLAQNGNEAGLPSEAWDYTDKMASGEKAEPKLSASIK